MKLADLNPKWVGYGGEGVTQNGQSVPRRERTAISFDCPCGCNHPVTVGIRNPVDGQGPVHGTTWDHSGDDFDILTLSPSIQREYPARCWHGWVTNGEVTTC